MILKGLRKVLIIVLREILIPGLIKSIRKNTCENATFSLFPFNISLFGTDFILKIITRIKEKVLINGIKI
ncbi:MAG: hypothetical protein HPY74_12620 [Firmicutes bacterium]|nr:hypothetical protein [Bacillota bacterium]